MFKGSMLATTAMIMVGSSVAVTGLVRHYPMYAGQAIRFGMAAVLLLLVLHLRTRRAAEPGPTASVRDWLTIIALAATGMVGFNVAIVAAERQTDPALVGVIVGCAPIVIALVSPLVNHQAPSLKLVAAGLVVTAGAGLAQGAGNGGTLAGLALSVCALAGETAFALVAVPVLGKLGALRVSTYACVAAVPLCVLGMLVTGDIAVPTPQETMALLWLGVIVTAFAYVCWFTAVGTLGAPRAGLFTSLIPISAVALTAILGTGTPTTGHYVGATLVLVGLLIGLHTPRTPPAPPLKPTEPAPETTDTIRP